MRWEPEPRSTIPPPSADDRSRCAQNVDSRPRFIFSDFAPGGRELSSKEHWRTREAVPFASYEEKEALVNTRDRGRRSLEVPSGNVGKIEQPIFRRQPGRPPARSTLEIVELFRPRERR